MKSNILESVTNLKIEKNAYKITCDCGNVFATIKEDKAQCSRCGERFKLD